MTLRSAVWFSSNINNLCLPLTGGKWRNGARWSVLPLHFNLTLILLHQVKPNFTDTAEKSTPASLTCWWISETSKCNVVIKALEWPEARYNVILIFMPLYNIVVMCLVLKYVIRAFVTSPLRLMPRQFHKTKWGCQSVRLIWNCHFSLSAVVSFQSLFAFVTFIERLGDKIWLFSVCALVQYRHSE